MAPVSVPRSRGKKAAICSRSATPMPDNPNERRAP